MADFELDPYLERLIALRETDPLAFAHLHSEVKKLIEEYEKEKAAAPRDPSLGPDPQGGGGE